MLLFFYKHNVYRYTKKISISTSPDLSCHKAYLEQPKPHSQGVQRLILDTLYYSSILVFETTKFTTLLNKKKPFLEETSIKYGQHIRIPRFQT